MITTYQDGRTIEMPNLTDQQLAAALAKAAAQAAAIERLSVIRHGPKPEWDAEEAEAGNRHERRRAAVLRRRQAR